MEAYPWWNEAQKKLAKEAQELADELMPSALESAWRKEYPWEVAREVAKRGWYGAIIPKKYGGHFEDWGMTGVCILSEESSRLGEFCYDFVDTVCIGGTRHIVHNGTEEQRQRWLPRIAKGELHTSIAITEPFAGSDAAALGTTGRREGDVYVVNGKKRFITNAGAAGLYMAYVKTSDKPEDRAKYKHLTALVIEKGMKGFSIEKVNELTGMDGVYNCFLNFDNVEVPVANRLGEEGEGWAIMTAGLNPERTLGATVALGRMREALRWAVYHLQRRVQFRQPTINIPINQFKVADMIMRLNVARLFTYYTAYLCDLGMDTPMHSAMVKLFNSETFARNYAMDAMQCMGGDGMTRFYPVERLMRDAKIDEIAGGTSEIMRLLIYRQGLPIMAEDLKAPRRVRHEELKVPFPARKGQLPTYAATEEGVLEALAENYRVNPGLYMTLQELKEQIEIAEEELTKHLTGLEEKGLADLYRNKKGALALARATYVGLAKAKPSDYYGYIPSWVAEEDMF